MKHIVIAASLFFLTIVGIAGKGYYGWKVSKKHMPEITFWEYYWGISK